LVLKFNIHYISISLVQ